MKLTKYLLKGLFCIEWTHCSVGRVELQQKKIDAVQ